MRPSKGGGRPQRDGPPRHGRAKDRPHGRPQRRGETPGQVCHAAAAGACPFHGRAKSRPHGRRAGATKRPKSAHARRRNSHGERRRRLRAQHEREKLEQQAIIEQLASRVNQQATKLDIARDKLRSLKVRRQQDAESLRRAGAMCNRRQARARRAKERQRQESERTAATQRQLQWHLNKNRQLEHNYQELERSYQELTGNIVTAELVTAEAAIPRAEARANAPRGHGARPRGRRRRQRPAWRQVCEWTCRRGALDSSDDEHDHGGGRGNGPWPRAD